MGTPGQDDAEMTDPGFDWGRSIFDHVQLRVADLAASRGFYGAVLGPLGVPVMIEEPGLVAFAHLTLCDDGEPSRGVHLAFVAASWDAVRRFHAAGVEHGAPDNGPPGVRDYGPPGLETYAAFLLDPDGNNVEAVCRTPVHP